MVRVCLFSPQTDPYSLTSVDVGKSPSIPYVYVRHGGEVQNYKPLQLVTACSLDIYNFPFDVQNCSLTFTSWLHTSEYLGLWVGQRLGLIGTGSQDAASLNQAITISSLLSPPAPLPVSFICLVPLWFWGSNLRPYTC